MYCIKEGYTENPDPKYSPEAGIKDSYQKEVYLEGLAILKEQQLSSVLDIGCARAFKLMKYFSHVKTLGLDLVASVNWLKSEEGFPDRDWLVSDFDMEAPKGYDLVICSDAIEHMIDPDACCEFIKRVNPKYAVISTPDRDLLSHRGVGETWNSDDGPPYNDGHAREWTFEEFGDYMRSHFNVIKHWYPNKAQVCQGVVVTMK